MSFTFTEDFNNDMHAHIDELFSEYRQRKTSRRERLEASDSLIESYVEYTGERPDSTALERLGTLILLDELTDPHPDKMTREEYPIMSDSQREERLKDEIPLKWAQSVAIDGRDYRVKTRDGNRKFRELTGEYN